MSVPAEWAQHARLFIGFPSRADVWGDRLAGAQQEVITLVLAAALRGGEQVCLAAGNEAARIRAAQMLGDATGVEIAGFDVGDVWLRDTGPVFRGDGSAAAFAFNGWGGQFEHGDDLHVARSIAAYAGLPTSAFPFVLEGGMLDCDGAGTALATEQCLLDPDRNRWSRADAEAALGQALGIRKVIWLPRGMIQDHTRGHIDNIARFVGEGRVAVSIAQVNDDPDAALYDDIAEILAGAEDADGRRLAVHRVRAPGPVRNAGDALMPASHLNFIIANRAVLVPVYGTPTETVALQDLQTIFPGRAVIGIRANSLLSEGGSFHCISQQQPLG